MRLKFRGKISGLSGLDNGLPFLSRGRPPPSWMVHAAVNNL